jgi:hypothetical protein
MGALQRSGLGQFSDHRCARHQPRGAVGEYRAQKAVSQIALSGRLVEYLLKGRPTTTGALVLVQVTVVE